MKRKNRELNKILWRVWFWFRMNVGGLFNICKLNGFFGVSGGWVSNVWEFVFRFGIIEGNFC